MNPRSRPDPLRGGRALAPTACLLLCVPLCLAARPAATPAPASPTPSPQVAAPQAPAPQPRSPQATAPADLVPIHIAGIRMVGPEQVLLFLADEKEERAVPMAVGRDQGVAIYLGKERAPTPRPMTHDLLVQILRALGATVEKVTVTELKEETYYAEIALRSGKTLHRIDARPSDAVALAVRLDVPMFAARGLLKSLSELGQPEVTTSASQKFGLSVQELDADLAESLGAAGVEGVLVSSVRPKSAAGSAGVRRGDVLQSIDGRPISDLETYGKAAAQADEAPRFGVWRDGAKKILSRP